MQFVPRPAFVLVLLAAVLVIAGCAAPTAAPVPTTAPPATTTPKVVVPTVALASLKSCNDGALEVSSVQPAAPTTPVPPTAAPAAVTVAPGAPTATARPPTATPRPAPQVDHVGFPEDYQTKFKFFFVTDRVENRQVRVVCGNEIAASVKPGGEFPFGSVMIFESWSPKVDSSGNSVLDSKGRLIRETLTTIFTMRKEKGFGADYQNFRSGEWEFVAYRPDKSVATAPSASTSCSSCHIGATQAKDFVFRPDLLFTVDKYFQTKPVGANEFGASDIGFYTAVARATTLSVKTGTTVKFTNNDDAGILHTAVARDGTFTSPALKSGDSFSFAFSKAGTYDFFCSLHPDQMTGRIEVKD
ncbi:MAG: cytochrome P460 family protein [Chloroflexi bacterium]|nr:cytochrome P460 family protein [Chloroflexota bacterium]